MEWNQLTRWVYIYIYYESQPKAWAEYRYKRSEAKLVWGVWGGRRLWFGRVLGRWGRSLPGESSKKRGTTSLVFEGWKRSSILDTFGCFLTFFWRFSSGVKSQNTVIYSVFGLLAWKKYFLQHAENCVNTIVFARCRPQNTVNTVVFGTRSKKHRKYRGFGLARRQKTRFLRCFLLRDSSKTRKHQRIDDFWALNMIVFLLSTCLYRLCLNMFVCKRVCV